MNITLMAHDSKKELMVQFCTAYSGILSRHSISATNTTGKLVSEATGLPITLFLGRAQGGHQQVGARIAYNEIDLVLFFTDPRSNESEQYKHLVEIVKLCDLHNVPIATNVASAEMLILGLQRGDLDWRNFINPRSKSPLL